MSPLPPDVSRFLKKLALAAVPAGLFLGLSLAFLFYSGELLPPDRVAELRLRDPASVSMYGCLYSNPLHYYQWRTALALSPRVLAFGTSRNQELRAQFFRPGVSFYNASGPASKPPSYLRFLNTIPEGRQPELLLLGLDQFFFNPNWEFYAEAQKPEFPDLYRRDLAEILKLGIPGVHRDLWKNGLPRDFAALRRAGRVGLGALLDRNGLRPDGSLSVNTARIKPTRFNEALRFIESGRHSFQYSAAVHEPAVAELEALLAYCRGRDIYVAAFLPPYAHEVLAKMEAMGEKYAYLPKLRARLPGVFARHGFALYDFTDLADAGASDAETIDGYHGSEKAYLRLFIKMAARDARLRQFADLPALEQKLAASDNDFTVFGD